VPPKVWRLTQLAYKGHGTADGKMLGLEAESADVGLTKWSVDGSPPGDPGLSPATQ